jgi:biotin-dependent carboxylase-like uncharacterized protein
MSARVISAGLSTQIQDFGRPGHRHNGIPLSGVADRLSLALANFCVGNRPDAAGLEITLIGPELRIDSLATIALCGANTDFSINGKAVKMNTGHSVSAGDVISVGRVTHGARSYLAISGGIKGSSFLGSVSTYSYANLGGQKGRVLKASDTIFWEEADQKSQSIPSGFAPHYGSAIILRAIKGPEYDRLDAPSKQALFSSTFHASSQTDRMGARLSGAKLTLSNAQSMISAPLLPGSLQLPQGGQPILMLVDGHCTGGYPRIAQVIAADHHKLGQIKPGARINLRPCTEYEALETLRLRTQLYQSLMPGFVF